MTDVDVQSLYQRIGAALVSAAPENWTRLSTTHLKASTTGQSRSFVTKENGSIESLREVSSDVYRAFKELRQILYQEGKGAWYTATATVTRDGTIDIYFDYDAEPAWDVPVVPRTYVEDLKKFPRDLEHQPAWLREKIREANA